MNRVEWPVVADILSEEDQPMLGTDIRGIMVEDIVPWWRQEAL